MPRTEVLTPPAVVVVDELPLELELLELDELPLDQLLELELEELLGVRIVVVLVAEPVLRVVPLLELDELPLELDELPLELDELPLELDELPLELDELPLELDELPLELDELPPLEVAVPE